MYKLATSPEVIDAMVAVLREKQGEFVSFHMACLDLDSQPRSYINDSLHYMRRGMLKKSAFITALHRQSALQPRKHAASKRRLKSHTSAISVYIG